MFVRIETNMCLEKHAERIHAIFTTDIKDKDVVVSNFCIKLETLACPRCCLKRP